MLIFLLLGAFSNAFAAASEPVPVRFKEGLTRGFLIVRDQAGKQVGTGDLTQVVHGNRVENKMLLRIKDGSVYDESLVFTQDEVLELQSYHVVQEGPSFEEALDARFDVAKGTYSVTSGAGEEAEVASGNFDIPEHLYNGLMVTVLKNIPRGSQRTVHVVTFTPEPRVIEVDIVPDGKQQVQVAGVKRDADRYVLKPRLGGVVGVLAKLVGKDPEPTECVIMKTDLPAFVRCDGALAVGSPIWRIEATTPADRTGVS